MIKIITWNLQSPSAKRLLLQLEYLQQHDADVLLLTEIKGNMQLNRVTEGLISIGYDVHHAPVIERVDYYSLIGTKRIKSRVRTVYNRGALASRFSFVNGFFRLGSINFVSVYFPAFHPTYSTPEKIAFKALFHSEFLSFIKSVLSGPSERLIIGGDFNLMAADHQPDWPDYVRWNGMYDSIIASGMLDCLKERGTEYSHTWYDNNGKGQLIDYLLIDHRLQRSLRSCEIDHTPRLNGLSDHSSVMATLF